jgi:Fe-S-cluster-containing hydrogenase component 2
MGAKNVAIKCDLCGGEPSCVAECLAQALVFTEPDKELRQRRGMQMKERCATGSPEGKRAELARRLVGAKNSL